MNLKGIMLMKDANLKRLFPLYDILETVRLKEQRTGQWWAEVKGGGRVWLPVGRPCFLLCFLYVSVHLFSSLIASF